MRVKYQHPFKTAVVRWHTWSKCCTVNQYILLFIFQYLRSKCYLRHIYVYSLEHISIHKRNSSTDSLERTEKTPKGTEAATRGTEGGGRACRHRAATSHMQEVTSQDSAEDLVGAAPAQEESGHKHMQEDQRQQDQGAPVRVSRLGYLPLLGQGLLQVGHFGLAAAELRLQLLTCLAEKGLAIRWEYERSCTTEARTEAVQRKKMQPQRKGGKASLNLPARRAAVSLDFHGNHERDVDKPWPRAQHPESPQSAPGGGRRLAAEPGTPWSTDGSAALTPRGKQSSKTKSKRTSKDIKTQSSAVCVSFPSLKWCVNALSLLISVLCFVNKTFSTSEIAVEITFFPDLFQLLFGSSRGAVSEVSVVGGQRRGLGVYRLLIKSKICLHNMPLRRGNKSKTLCCLLVFLFTHRKTPDFRIVCRK